MHLRKLGIIGKLYVFVSQSGVQQSLINKVYTDRFRCKWLSDDAIAKLYVEIEGMVENFVI